MSNPSIDSDQPSADERDRDAIKAALARLGEHYCRAVTLANTQARPL